MPGLGPPRRDSPATGKSVPSYYIHCDSAHFRDCHGRTLLLRGINLASSAKTPQGQPGAKKEGFWEHGKDGQVSFVNRVLNLDDGSADEHLARLKSWGFNSLRYIFTWEAIEHEGPGRYDDQFIDYTVRMLRKCKEYGFLVFMDPHQDLFSRFSGGDGAPYWALIACGLEPQHFTETGAAYLECEWPSPSSPDPASFPAMIWASNYSRLACQTLFTLWAAGRDFAPKCIINGVNIQDFLQEHYFNAVRQLGVAMAKAGDLLDECVIGWDSLNEPNAGFLSVPHLGEHGKESILRVGPMPTAYQGMQLGMGNAVQVENWKFGPLGPKRDGSIAIDPKGKRAWLDPDAERDGSPYGWVRDPDWQLGTCIWALHGVWDPDTEELLEPDYFMYHPDEQTGDSKARPSLFGPSRRKLEFGQDYWLPHWQAYAKVVREFHPEAILFALSPVFQVPPKIEGPDLNGRVVHSTHFYDGLTLVTKHWNWFNADALGILRGKYPSVMFGVKVGEKAIRKCMRDQLGMLRQDAFDSIGQVPTMMGEIGIPYDLDGKKAYRDGDYSNQLRALDASLNACDGSNVLNYAIWTYCPDNSHEWGDRWNGEDLSVWSPDDRHKMTNFRSAEGMLDVYGKIPRTRSRAASRSSSISIGSRRGSSTNLAASTGSLKMTASPASSSPFLRKAALERSPMLAEGGATLSNSPSGTPSSTVDASPFAPLTKATSSLSVKTVTTTTQNGMREVHVPKQLNDGARALPAFVRPFPQKTVGRPVEIDFDIRSSVFKCTVELEASEVRDDDEGGNALCTEIYVPLVHYAAYPSRVTHFVRYNEDSLPEAEKDELASSISSLSTVDDSPFERDNNDEAGSKAADREPPRVELTKDGLSSESEDPNALAIDVKLSAGSWQLGTGTDDRQTLYWSYPRPASGSGKVRYTIEIKRTDGAIPAWVSSYGQGAKNNAFDRQCVEGIGWDAWGLRGKLTFIAGTTALVLAATSLVMH